LGHQPRFPEIYRPNCNAANDNPIFPLNIKGSNMFHNIPILIFAACTVFVGTQAVEAMGDEQPTPSARPNILWITIEDWSPDLSCYGTKGLQTPHVDKLAAEGIRYERAFTTSPVCSTSRSAMMTGFYQNYIGANQHRTADKRPLPHGIKPIPHLLKEAGYYTALMSYKTDCNFLPDKREELFTGNDWNQREPDQPFFARITFGGTHRSWKRDSLRPIDPKNVEIPPYYPDTPLVRADWANGLEQMQIVDRQVGELLQRLSDEGLAENTLVIFIGDHGRCHIRGKQFLYDGGIRIPMILRWPGKIEPNQINDDMVMSIDLCATILEAAGVEAPVPLHGKSLRGDDVKNRKYIFSARDKMDETHDSMRAIRSRDFKLIHNLMPERPWCQFNRYKESAYPVLAEMNVLHMEGKLTSEQAQFLAPSKPEFELFNLNNDPHELKNLADDENFASVKEEMLAALNNWRENVIMDQGVSEEFRAVDVFPTENPMTTVAEWARANEGNFDFKATGWPAWYPTRTLDEWKKVRSQWEPYIFRKSEGQVAHPVILHTQRDKKKNKKKANGAQPQTQFQPLFNGKDLSQFIVEDGTAPYRVEDGVIIGRTMLGSPNTFLATKKSYGDFELTFETKISSGLNSGVQIRSFSRKNDGRFHGPQVEIEDSPGEAGNIYGEAMGGGWLTKPQNTQSHFKNGQWNRYRVIAKGASISTFINGEKITETVDESAYASHPKGHIGLQVHSIQKKKLNGAEYFEARWRNLKIKEISGK
jgi:uncharacterized sulfatase